MRDNQRKRRRSLAVNMHKMHVLTVEIDAIYDCIGQLLAQIIVERLVSEGVRELR